MHIQKDANINCVYISAGCHGGPREKRRGDDSFREAQGQLVGPMFGKIEGKRKVEWSQMLIEVAFGFLCFSHGEPLPTQIFDSIFLTRVFFFPFLCSDPLYLKHHS